MALYSPSSAFIYWQHFCSMSWFFEKHQGSSVALISLCLPFLLVWYLNVEKRVLQVIEVHNLNQTQWESVWSLNLLTELFTFQRLLFTFGYGANDALKTFKYQMLRSLNIHILHTHTNTHSKQTSTKQHTRIKFSNR